MHIILIWKSQSKGPFDRTGLTGKCIIKMDLSVVRSESLDSIYVLQDSDQSEFL
jgi:hypothetical protein